MIYYCNMLRAVQVFILLFHTALSLNRGASFNKETSSTGIQYSVLENIQVFEYVPCVAKCLELTNCLAAIVSEGNVMDICKLLLQNDIAAATYDVEDSTIWLKRHIEPTELPDSSKSTTRDETTTMMLMPTTEDDSCPDNFTQKASGCFYMETDSLKKETWQGAEDYCQEFRDNIHLAETNTTEKRSDITSMMTGQVNSVWIGARDRDNDNIIRYVKSGDVISDSNPLWMSGEPTHTYASGDNTYQLDCVYMNSSGEYRLVRCDIPDYFVCEV